METSQAEVQVRKPRILIVDDEVAMVRSLELLLRPVGDVYKAYSVPEAEEFLEKKVDCIVTDVCMPEASGLTLLEKVKKACPETPVVIMTAYSSVPEAVEAIQMGAFEYLTKPFENNDMISTVKRAVEKKGITAGETRNIPDGWICNSESMHEFLNKAEKLAVNSSPVLLVGEKGVGKKRAARWMYERGRTKRSSFIALDAKMFEEDSPLLTYKFQKSTFVFISEVFSLSRRLQDKLTEMLREGRIKLIAGTCTSPSLQASEGFREDLYDILTTHVLHVPSLKERAADFEALCGQILESIRTRMKLKSLSLDQQALDLLKRQTFIGNVKELEQCLERAAIEARVETITEKDLKFQSPDLSQQMPFSIPVEGGWARLEFLNRSLEKELIERAIDKYPNTSNAQIASILGTTRRILELRMKSYSIREG